MVSDASRNRVLARMRHTIAGHDPEREPCDLFCASNAADQRRGDADRNFGNGYDKDFNRCDHALQRLRANRPV